MTEPKRKPIREIRRVFVRGTVWENHTDKGTRYGVTFSRLYRDSKTNKWTSTSSFDPKDLLALSEVARLAFHELHQLKEDAEGEAEVLGGEAPNEEG
jgi:hypothetical protein